MCQWMPRHRGQSRRFRPRPGTRSSWRRGQTGNQAPRNLQEVFDHGEAGGIGWRTGAGSEERNNRHGGFTPSLCRAVGSRRRRRDAAPSVHRPAAGESGRPGLRARRPWRARRAQAPGAEGPRVLLYLHGGGFCAGSIVSHRAMVTEAGRAAQARTLAIDYRRPPEQRAGRDASGSGWHRFRLAADYPVECPGCRMSSLSGRLCLTLIGTSSPNATAVHLCVA
jgi:alpha/beta hydrolase fold